MLQQSLLEQAKKLSPKPGKRPRKYNTEEFELILAWLNDEVPLGIIGRVMKFRSRSEAYPFLVLGIKELYKLKRISILEDRIETE